MKDWISGLSRNTRKDNSRLAFVSILFLMMGTTLIPLGCGQTFVIKDDESTQIMRVGKDIKNWPVFIPGEDKSWVPAMSDISKGDVIYTNPENLKDILDSAKIK